MRTNGEDTDMSRRLREKGWDLLYDPEPLCGSSEARHNALDPGYLLEMVAIWRSSLCEWSAFALSRWPCALRSLPVYVPRFGPK